ncbi:MAG: flagellar biosynthetic protein FliO [Treponema sp.]|nr:flagellar biosynthetic protein FliO [Treponema sp.]
MSKFALLLLAVGLFAQITPISAQDMPDTSVDPSPAVEDQHRIAEEGMPLRDTGTPSAPGTGSSIWLVIRMILVLALAAAAIYGIVFVIKRSSKQTVTNDPFLKVLASSSIGLNRYVHIVSVGSKAWLVGAGEGTVSLISEIDDKEIIDAMLLEDSKKTAQTPGRFPDFLALLRRFGAQAEKSIPGVDEIRKRRERLKGL